jgi:hydrogenase maturation protein HypF
MVADVDAAREWFAPTAPELDALTTWRAPIVLIAAARSLAPSVAPGFARHGVMLPSTPLHHLLARAAGRPLVMTSGNASEEPICVTNSEAADRLASIADLVLVHDRDVVARYDDSVVRVRSGATVPTVVRRARSFAPTPIDLAADVPPTLGTGALLHGAFCLAAGGRAFLSQHVGDLDTEESMAAYVDALDRFREVFRIEPEVVAHDLHPDFMTTRFAGSLGLPRVAVQHHHAHVAATMAEHGLEGDVLGLAFDGLGLGDDGTVWGGELLVCSAATYRRVGRLRQVVQPGGDAATRDPIRIALAHAHDAGVFGLAVDRLGAPPALVDVVERQIETGLASPLTSSAGRSFDAVAAIAGVCRSASFEGQPAMLLEEAVREMAAAGPPPVVARLGDGLLELDTRPLILDAFEPGDVAARFHAGFAAMIAEAAITAASDAGLDRVVLGGGVFHNDVLTSALTARLTAAGLRVFLPIQVPVGDGGIALGQVLVANATKERI